MAGKRSLAPISPEKSIWTLCRINAVKRWISKALGISAKIGGLVLLFLFGLTCWLHTRQAHQWIGRIVNQTIPGKISWADSDLSLLAGTSP